MVSGAISERVTRRVTFRKHNLATQSLVASVYKIKRISNYLPQNMIYIVSRYDTLIRYEIMYHIFYFNTWIVHFLLFCKNNQQNYINNNKLVYKLIVVVNTDLYLNSLTQLITFIYLSYYYIYIYYIIIISCVTLFNYNFVLIFKHNGMTSTTRSNCNCVFVGYFTK